MTFFPAGFDPRTNVVGLMELVTIDTPDGVFGFLPGEAGFFSDINGQTYIGSVMISSPSLAISVGGEATEGEIGLSFVRDPAGDDLIGEVLDLGADYLAGRDIVWWVQPISAYEELQAPVHAPLRVLTRKMTRIRIVMQGQAVRSIRVGFEGPFAARQLAQTLYYTDADHAALTGSANPSLTFAPPNEYTEVQMSR